MQATNSWETNPAEYYETSLIGPIIKLGRLRGHKSVERDFNSHAIMMSLSKANTLCATPFWEGMNGIAIYVDNFDGTVLASGLLDYKVTGNPEEDATAYWNIIDGAFFAAKLENGLPE